MSRVGNKIIPLPKGVKIVIGDQMEVEGPKGKLTVPLPAGIHIKQTDGNMTLTRDTDKHAPLHGLTRALVAAAVQGVSTGFTREMDITGVGYRADVKGKLQPSRWVIRIPSKSCCRKASTSKSTSKLISPSPATTNK